MADTRKIVIEIKSIGDDSSKSTRANAEEVSANSKKISQTTQTLTEGNATPDKSSLARNALVTQTVAMAINSVKNIGQYHIYKYFTLSEDYLNENLYRNVMTGVSKIASFGTSIAAGAVAGATVGGPIGAVVGGAVSLVGSTISMITDIEKNWFQQSVQINTQNYQTAFQQTRLGLIEGRGVTNQ